MGDILQGIAALTQAKNPVAWQEALAGPPGFGDFPGPVPPAPPGYIDESGALGSAPEAPPGFYESYANSDPAPVPGGDAGQDTVVSGFKPKKRSFLGLLGDAFLLHSGHKGPFFADRIERKNMERAFEGFTKDPMETVRRVAMFNPEAAWKMREQLVDNERMDLDKQSIRAARQEKILNSLSGLAGAVYEDGSNYDIIRDRWNQTIRRNNISDVAMLPDEYDSDLMNAIFKGGLTPNQSEMNRIREIRETRQAKEGERRLDQKDRSLDQTDRRLNQDEIEERGRNDRSAAAINARSIKGDGNGVTHKVNPGENVQIRRKGGQIVAARVNRNGQWLRLSPEAFELFKEAMEK